MTTRHDEPAPRAEERHAMVAEIEAEASATAGWTGKRAFSPRVLEALASVPRHEFVPPDAQAAAYANTALPIGRGQTISQPYIVALMTDLVHPTAEATVLEVGTGCGYQAAILAELVRRVYSVEIVAELAGEAAARLERLGYANVEIRSGDGYEGWSEHAPFDAILVTAAARELPPRLLEQLAPGGRLVIPLGEPWHTQELVVFEKDEKGSATRRVMLPVAFVPMTRAH